MIQKIIRRKEQTIRLLVRSIEAVSKQFDQIFVSNMPDCLNIYFKVLGSTTNELTAKTENEEWKLIIRHEHLE